MGAGCSTERAAWRCGKLPTEFESNRVDHRCGASRPSAGRHRAMSRYRLPDLPYDFSALEPAISGQIMELHHGKHHAAYVKNANEASARLDEARASGDIA